MAILQANKDYYLLRKQAYINKFLDRIKHPDSTRISTEIITHIKENFTKGLKRNHQNMPDNIANKRIDEKIEKILVRLEKDEPWEYIRGWAEFMEMRFKVNKNVLIPRIETEVLVTNTINSILEYVIVHREDKIRVIDIGTGSGCIAISLESKIKESLKAQQINVKRGQIQFLATDISEQALEVAKHNAKSLKSSVKFIKTNILESINAKKLMGCTIFIISNPPYIPTAVCKKLQPSVKNYEPRTALDGGRTGDTYYKEIFNQLHDKSLSPTSMFFEIDKLVVNKIIKLALKNKFSYVILNDYRGLIRYAIIRSQK